MPHRKLIHILVCLLTISTTGTILHAQESPRPVTPIEYRESLTSTIDALIEARQGAQPRQVRIMQYGDSHTAADLFTGALRKYFQRDFGDAARNGTGVTLGIKGRNGMRARQLLHWSDQEFYQHVTLKEPDLVIIAFGTNEVTDRDWSQDSYRSMFGSIIRRFRRFAPQAAILVLGPPDRTILTERGWRPTERMQTLIEAQRLAAQEEGASFWSARDAMGGDGSINAWANYGLAQSDHAHLTSAGYKVLARHLYTAFVEAYNAHVTTLNAKR